jgi:hypothetical protein
MYEVAPLAQMVEQLTLNQWVAGSIPARRRLIFGIFFSYYFKSICSLKIFWGRFGFDGEGRGKVAGRGPNHLVNPLEIQLSADYSYALAA